MGGSGTCVRLPPTNARLQYEAEKSLGSDRSAEIEPLRLVTFQTAKNCELARVLHSFGDNDQAHGVRHSNNAGDYYLAVFGIVQRRHEGLIDLQDIEWKL